MPALFYLTSTFESVDFFVKSERDPLELKTDYLRRNLWSVKCFTAFSKVY